MRICDGVWHVNVMQGLKFFVFKQKTAYEMRISDWSSDVCSSDLPAATESTPVQRPCSRTAPTAQPNTGRIRLSLFKRELDRTGAEAGHRHAEDPFALGGHITGADRLIEFLGRDIDAQPFAVGARAFKLPAEIRHHRVTATVVARGDRKSTRLNSSH